MSPSRPFLLPVQPTALERWLTMVAVVGLYAMATLVTVNVTSRWIGRAIIPDDIQLVQELMVLVILLPLGAVTARREHISVDLLTDWVSVRGKRGLAVFEHGIGIIFVGLVAYAAFYGAVDTWESQDYHSGVLDIPMWIGRFTFLFGITLFLIRLVLMFVYDLRRIF